MRYDSYYHVGTGVFSKSYANGGFLLGTSQQYNAMNEVFDANSSSSIYTNNGKIYPLSVVLNFIIKI